MLVVQKRAAGIFVISIHRSGDAVDGEIVFFQRERVDFDLVLLGQSTEWHHIGHARDLQNSRSDYPILKLPQLNLVVLLWRLEAVPVQFADGRGQWAEGRARAVGQIRVLQFLRHHLAREIVVGAVREGEFHHGQTKDRAGSASDDLRNAIQSALDGYGDLLLHLFRRMAGEDRDNDHLSV